MRDDAGLGRKPVGTGIEGGQLLGGGPWIEADEAAVGAFNNKEIFGGGAIETVSSAKERVDGRLATAWAFLSYADCSDSLRKGMRYCSSNFLTCAGLSLR